ncbi:nitrous oxide reductase accessory protein NosL [Marinobacter halophilus]|uniref:Nitrous oxide reductase accessory protein NosL n=1 Tax=Marinobacter halophilus TaxID=1323740 RepID=A0A2T1KE63_9GAMM|nr:nitrous oxide reductase accessory protein NosL [Marinobacter halophilus]PSF08405.1 nitrous oxide reductase accessory protein NosL [Marinobacter halophilus]GGC60294.1 hypothetical protein GCM10011362_05950 [Marinobacter halophilus]
MAHPITKWFIAGLAAITLAGCSGDDPQTLAKPDPVHFESGDECHVCGMVITNFPGPKGQAFTEREQNIRKFCSTKDMFAWFLQPENENRDHTLYVHNMAQTHWEHLEDTHLIDARKAWYVVGSNRTGAMGPTLASFETKTEAVDFAAEHGGEVLAFSDITMGHLNAGIAMHGMDGMDGMGSHQDMNADHSMAEDRNVRSGH